MTDTRYVLELRGFDVTFVRKIGHLCHNRRFTAEELTIEMNDYPSMDGWSRRRVHRGLAQMVRLGLIERECGTYYPTNDGWAFLEKVLGG